MSVPRGTTLVERTEWLLGLGEPNPRSRFWVAYLGSLAALSLGLILWPFASGGGWPRDTGLMALGSLFLSLWGLSDVGGTLLFARFGAASGRGVRVLGYACFLPLAMGFYLVYFWTVSTAFFVVEALVLGGWLVWAVVGIVRRAFQLCNGVDGGDRLYSGFSDRGVVGLLSGPDHSTER